VQKGVDLGLGPIGELMLDDPKDPRRGRDRVDQFFIPILWRLGEDEFLRLIRFHSFDFVSSGRTPTSTASCSIESINQDDQRRSERGRIVTLSFGNNLEDARG
jgi:hypothetical protein